LEEIRLEQRASLQMQGWILKYYLIQVEKDAEDPRSLRRHDRVRSTDFRARARQLVESAPNPRKDPEPLYAAVLISLFTWPVLWVIWAFLTRGGLSHRILGLSLVRSDGRRASRLRCAWRALLVWAPVTALLALSTGLEVWHWANWTLDDPTRYQWVYWLAVLLWWAALILLGAFLVMALWSPSRSLHDRLAGTWLVPR
jgi:hypothetical protein